jgi:hypothetical protein
MHAAVNDPSVHVVPCISWGAANITCMLTIGRTLLQSSYVKKNLPF